VHDLTLTETGLPLSLPNDEAIIVGKTSERRRTSVVVAILHLYLYSS